MVTGRAGHGVGDQDQRGCTGLGHGRRTHDGLPRAARQYHHPRSAGPERVSRHLLEVSQFPAILRQADRMGLAIDVAGQILGRQPILSSICLTRPRSLGCTRTVSSSTRAPSIGVIFLLRSTSARTAWSILSRHRPWAGCLTNRSRP